MARVPLIQDLSMAGPVDDEDRRELERFFAHFNDYHRRYRSSVDVADTDESSSSAAESETPRSVPRANWAALANSPKLANELLETGEFMVNDIAWCRRIKQRELMYVALSHHLGFHSLYTYHYRLATQVGVTAEQLAHLPFRRVNDAFDVEERFVIDYTKAVLENAVTDDLFEQGRELYGTKEMVELTAVIGYSAFKVMTYRALRAFVSNELE
jgi:alkylhydroperoxidase/carboxymuconolactone decarboxylase family protein YurZ